MASILDDGGEIDGDTKRKLIEDITRLIEERLPGPNTDGDVMGDRVLVAHLALGYQIADVYEGHGPEQGRKMLEHVVKSMPDVMSECLVVYVPN